MINIRCSWHYSRVELNYFCCLLRLWINSSIGRDGNTRLLYGRIARGLTTQNQGNVRCMKIRFNCPPNFKCPAVNLTQKRFLITEAMGSRFFNNRRTPLWRPHNDVFSSWNQLHAKAKGYLEWKSNLRHLL